MPIFLPDIYQKSIYAINYENLKNAGIKIILFDLDNTLVPISAKAPTKKVVDLFDDIKKIGLKPIIMSNSGKNRVEPFKEGLVVDAAFSSMKPLKRKYKKILSLYNVKPSEVAAVGDQLLTDILGANRMGFTSILVNQISTNDFKCTKINRIFEGMIIDHYTKQGVFKKGEYYE
jgi:hypothetical protein